MFFNIRFMVVFLFCMFCFLFCVFCIVLCIVSPLVHNCAFLFVYKFTDHCHQVETELQLINIMLYHIYTFMCDLNVECF